MSAQSDTVLRVMTDDGAFRAVVLRTTDTVRGIISAQKAAGSIAQKLGDLATGTVMVRETMAPQLRVQGVARAADGKAQLVADAHPSGMCRGLVQRRGGTAFDTGAGSLLQMMRTLPNGSINRGVVEIPDEGGMSKALMSYMQSSEQVTSMVAVGTVLDGDTVVAAGGYMVQLLPEVDRGPLAVMTERLEDFRTIDAQLAAPDFSPRKLAGELFYGMPYTELEESALRYECWCSEVRVVSALATIQRSEIEAMIADGDVLEINCDYCGEEYRVSPAQLRGLLEES